MRGMTMEFYTSDLHFGHKNILKHEPDRPFKDVDHMDRELVARYNDVISDDDVVYILGDLSMGNLSNALALVEKMKGLKYFIPGNHDENWIGHKKQRSAINAAYTHAGLHVVQGPVSHVLGNRRHVVMSHFPQQCDFRRQARDTTGQDFSYEPDRFEPYRPKAGPVLHGHVHSMWKKRGTDVNVGIDVWNYQPVDADTLLKLLDSDYND
jgi:calcineurin-like phosphoesterase family protein